jgi:hypothetical protein
MAIKWEPASEEELERRKPVPKPAKKPKGKSKSEE